MTEEQRLMFREILDINWEMTHEQDMMARVDLAIKLGAAQERLKLSMGAEAYDQFIATGRRMFAPQEAEVVD